MGQGSEHSLVGATWVRCLKGFIKVLAKAAVISRFDWRKISFRVHLLSAAFIAIMCGTHHVAHNITQLTAQQLTSPRAKAPRE